jgi:hypothetical protein
MRASSAFTAHCSPLARWRLSLPSFCLRSFGRHILSALGSFQKLFLAHENLAGGLIGASGTLPAGRRSTPRLRASCRYPVVWDGA